MIGTFETGHQGAWTKSPELPMDGRVLEIEGGSFSGKAFYNYLTRKWRSFPDGYLLSSGDECLRIAQWRETGLSVQIGE